MKHLRKFNEANQISGSVVPATIKETLTSYYICRDCNEIWKTFNEESESCSSCRSNNIENISDFDYMAEMKKKDDSVFKKEMRDKKDREDTMVNLMSLGDYNKYRDIKRNTN